MALDMFMYSGVWNEVASTRSSMAWIDTKAVYEYDPDRDEMDVQFQSRSISGPAVSIKGIMRCPVQKTPVMCSVRFPTAPFVPTAAYRILDTDYESYALVDSPGETFMLSRYSRPGLRFIETQKEKLKAWGIDPDSLHITPVTGP
jgi:lipocalin